MPERSLKQPSAGTNPDRFPNRVYFDFRMDLLVGGKLVKINMQDAIGQRMLLNGLEKSEFLLGGLGALD
jgi:hypothetical protein